MENQKGYFHIGDVIDIGKERWRVIKYHKIGKSWDVMLRSEASGAHRSFSCSELVKWIVHIEE